MLKQISEARTQTTLVGFLHWLAKKLVAYALPILYKSQYRRNLQNVVVKNNMRIQFFITTIKAYLGSRILRTLKKLTLYP